MLAAVLEIVGDVGRVRGILYAQQVARVVQTHEDDRHVLGEATHHPTAATHEELDHLAATYEIVGGAWQQVGQAYLGAATGRSHGKQVAMRRIMLEVVDVCHDTSAGREAGVERDVDLLAA
jgi:hypothetical protein